MKNKKIVVLLILNIILVGINCNLVIKKENIIKEKQIIKEMNESEYDSQITELNKSHIEYATQVQENKRKIAEAITNQNISTSENATIDEMVTNIGKIFETRTSDATATAEDIADGKTAYVNGNLITGTASNGMQTSVFSSYHWDSNGNNYYTTSQYDISNFNTIKLTVSKDQPDGTITIRTNNRTLLSTNCSSMSTQYTFDVSNDTVLVIDRVFTYGYLGITISKE